MRKLFSLFLALVATTSLWAEDFSVGGIYYNYLEDNKVEVTYRGDYSGSYDDEYSGEVIIPETVTHNGTTYSVTSIGAYAFRGCSSLTSITIPNSVTSIGDNAFEYCSSLTSVAIPNSVTSIGGMHAFAYCSSLTSVTIPNSVTSIGSYAFESCSSLTSIIIPNSVTSIGAWAFAECSSLTSVTIPNSVTSIGSYAFFRCYTLTSITIPNSVTSIEGSTFSGCSSLTSVAIPNSVTSIGMHAFSYCDSLTSITIPEGVTSIGIYAFYNCSSLTTPVYNAHCFAYMPTSFKGAYVIPEGIKQIAGGAFADCSSLTSITIPNSVTSIGIQAFRYCSSLDTLTCLAMTPPALEEDVFYGCDNPTLFVPCEALPDYQAHEQWGQFTTIECIASEEAETEEVVIESGTTTVIITWPTEEGADTYTIVIKKDGEVVCTLTFNSEGQLISIAFAPGRNGNHPAQYAEAVANGKGFRFTVTGLEDGTDYTYDITVKDAANKTISEHSGEFTTNSATALDNTHSPSPMTDCQKVLRNGQLIILRDGVEYNAIGQEL